jgi:5-methyltetrahydrofolate--homocysteine methyltransferase
VSDILSRLARCVERGKERRDSAYPPDLAGEDGALELATLALEQGASPNDVLRHGMVVGMNAVGDRFARGEAFVPELLLSAKAMKAGMSVLRPYFESGEATHLGTVILGTVAGDIHDIGKNIVGMVLEGGGWKVVDLGVDVTTEQFLAALDEHSEAIVGMSALLTTTMVNMAATAQVLREQHAGTRLYIGGAPVTQEFCDRIGADGYFGDPTDFARHLSTLL